MAWIADTYQGLRPGEIDALGAVTGKPVTQGGVRGRREATGLGVFYGLREVCNMHEVMDRLGLNIGVEGKRVIIQGLGDRKSTRLNSSHGYISYAVFCLKKKKKKK